MNLIALIQVYKLILVLLISTVKFFFAPFLSIGYGFNYIETVTITTIGGITGVFFFYYLSKWVIKLFNTYSPRVISYFAGADAKRKLEKLNNKKQKRKKFTRKNKFIINFRNKYGFTGIIILTPILLSIPIGAFLAQKYYSENSYVLALLSISVVVWSFLISSIYFFF